MHTAKFVVGVAIPEFAAFFRFSELGIHISENVVKYIICFFGLTTLFGQISNFDNLGVSNSRRIFDYCTIASPA